MELEGQPAKPENENSEPQDHQQQEADAKEVVPTRSYECNFCKRGFSNAQALGGHMNIHRKDKAKLRQAHQTQPHQHQQPSNSPLMMSRPPWFVDENSTNPPSKGISTDNICDQPRQLPLLAEPPLPPHHQNLDRDHHAIDAKNDKGLPSSSSLRYTAGSDDELDLELRLGPEPHQDAPSPTIGTRNFFY